VRLLRLRNEIFKNDVNALVVCKPQNVRYLSNFSGSTAVMLITKENSFLLVDFRYYKQAKNEVLSSCCEVRLSSDFFNDVKIILNELNLNKVGFESEYLTFEQHKSLSKKLQGVELAPFSHIVEDLRVVKDENEIEKISKAAYISDKVFENTLGLIKLGLTEIDIAAKIEYSIKKMGAEKTAFDTIVASGSNSAMPHAKPTNRKFGKGDFIKIDLGVMFQGYCSDMSRTVVLGKADEKKIEIYNTVLRAQQAVLCKIKKGMKFAEADNLARDIISSAGYGDNFGHNLGHGVGLEIHEAPTLGSKGKGFFESGMVFTIEPGIYIEGFGGVRIEDLAVLRDDSVEILTKSPKELMEL